MCLFFTMLFVQIPNRPCVVIVHSFHSDDPVRDDLMKFLGKCSQNLQVHKCIFFQIIIINKIFYCFIEKESQKATLRDKKFQLFLIIEFYFVKEIVSRITFCLKSLLFSLSLSLFLCIKGFRVEGC